MVINNQIYPSKAKLKLHYIQLSYIRHYLQQFLVNNRATLWVKFRGVWREKPFGKHLNLDFIKCIISPMKSFSPSSKNVIIRRLKVWWIWHMKRKKVSIFFLCYFCFTVGGVACSRRRTIFFFNPLRKLLMSCKKLRFVNLIRIYLLTSILSC